MDYYWLLKKFIVISTFSVFFCTYSFAQIDPPALLANNSAADINFLNCQAIVPINFSSGYTAWAGNVNYTWKLYRNNVEIAEHIQNTHFNKCIAPQNCPGISCQCELPLVTFIVAPISGSYKVRLIAESYIAIIFVFIKTSTVFDQYSNVINVTRFDDAYVDCKCDVPQNLSVDCNELKKYHEGQLGSFFPFQPPTPPQAYTVEARTNLYADCDITPNGQPVTFKAGKKVSLLPGFRSGDAFRAYLINCPQFKTGHIANNNSSNYSYPQPTNTNQKEDSVSNPIMQENENVFSLHPNPTTGKLLLTAPISETGISTVSIYNVLGRVVFQSQLHNTNTQIDLTSLPAALYFLTFESRTETGDVFRETKKLVKLQ